jgi:hypothetical protein
MAWSQGTSVSSISFSRWTSHDIFLFKYHFLLHIVSFLFFFSDNIKVDVASKQQTTALFLSTIDIQNWQTWWEICAVPENIQFSFLCSFFTQLNCAGLRVYRQHHCCDYVHSRLVLFLGYREWRYYDRAKRVQLLNALHRVAFQEAWLGCPAKSYLVVGCPVGAHRRPSEGPCPCIAWSCFRQFRQKPRPLGI